VLTEFLSLGGVKMKTNFRFLFVLLVLTIILPKTVWADDLWNDIAANRGLFSTDGSAAIVPGDLGDWSTENQFTIFRTYYGDNYGGRMETEGVDPAAGVNLTDANLAVWNPNTLVARGFILHPSEFLSAGVFWSPEVDGEYEVSVRFWDFENTCGNGVDWELMKVNADTTVILPGNGSIPQNGDTGTMTYTLQIQAGDRIGFLVGPGDSDDYSCDGTYVDIEIQAISEEGAIPTLSEWGMIIMSLMLLGSALWIMRRRQML